MSSYFVSVVITVFNYGSFVSQAIQSAISQTYNNIEIVVIDDGSTDDTRDRVRPFLVDKRVRYIYQENEGHPKAKNRGILESKGDLIAFLDADDVWLPQKLEKQVSLFSSLNVGVVYCKRKLLLPDNSIQEFIHPKLFRGKILNNIFIDNFICFSSSIVRRKCFNDVGIFDETISMNCDYDLWIRMSAFFYFDYVPEDLVLYRIGHSQMSRNKMKTISSALEIMNKNLLNKHIASQIEKSCIAKSFGMTYCSEAILLKENGDIINSIKKLCKSLLLDPFSSRTWKEIIKIIIGKKLINAIRRISGCNFFVLMF